MIDPTFPIDAAPFPVRLLDQVRARIRVKHDALRTEKVYVDWVKRFIRFHDRRHPRDMGAAEVEAFLTHLAVDRHVSAATENQAKAALLFLYKEVLVAAGYGDVEMPYALDIKSLRAGKQWQCIRLSERQPLRRSPQRRDPAPSSVSPDRATRRQACRGASGDSTSR